MKTSSAGGLKFVIVTVSTTKHGKKMRNETVGDQSGDIAESLVKGAGHDVTKRFIIPDDLSMLRTRMTDFLQGQDEVIVFTGGTGVSPDDITIEAVRPHLDKELEGFGEMLRDRSYRRIGVPAFLTRATAGIAHGKLVVCLPGSPDAVKTALQMFIGQFPEVVRRTS